MARATAVCTCRECGNTFEKWTTKHNRREADAWEEWARQNFDLCPDCYKAQKQEESKALGLVAEARLDDTAALLKGAAEVVIVIVNGGYERKDELKAAGYRWTEDFPASRKSGPAGLLLDIVGGPETKMWAKRMPLADLAAAVEEIQVMGGKIKLPSEGEQAGYADALRYGQKKAAEKSAAAAEAEAKVAAALEALGPCPEYPEDVAAILAAGRWNGKIYGRRGNWSIYISGDKQALTDAQKEALVATQEARQEWRAKKAAAEAEARA